MSMGRYRRPATPSRDGASTPTMCGRPSYLVCGSRVRSSLCGRQTGSRRLEMRAGWSYRLGTALVPSRRLSATLRQRRMSQSDALVVLTTVSTAEDAVTLIRALLDRRLIACGTLLPGARSLYRWEGKVADEHEVVVILKTAAT